MATPYVAVVILLLLGVHVRSSARPLDSPVHFHHRDLEKVHFEVTKHCVAPQATFEGVQNFGNRTINIRISNGRLDSDRVVDCFMTGLLSDDAVLNTMGLTPREVNKKGELPIVAQRPTRLSVALIGKLKLTIKGSTHVLHAVHLGHDGSQWWIASRACTRWVKQGSNSNDLQCLFSTRAWFRTSGNRFGNQGLDDFRIRTMFQRQFWFEQPRCEDPPCRQNENFFHISWLRLKCDAFSRGCRRLQEDAILV